MSAPETALTVVVPLRDERDSLPELHRRLRESLDPLGRPVEFIYVDDGSVDGSFETLREIHAREPGVRVIRFRRSFGKAAALAEGFACARGRIIVTIDADLQDDPAEVPRLIAALEDGGLDLVSGWKRRRHDPLSKRLPSRLFNWVTGRVTGIRIHDMNCGLKAYRHEVVAELRVYGGLYRFLPAFAHWKGFRVGEVEVQHHARRFGRSKYGWRRLLDGFFDLLTVILTTRYTRRPLHFFGGAGALLGLGGFAICLYILGLWARFGDIRNRHPLLILGVLLLLLGVQLVSTGLMAELIVRFRGEGRSDASVRERLE